MGHDRVMHGLRTLAAFNQWETDFQFTLLFSLNVFD
jgi:hypothetical protein